MEQKVAIRLVLFFIALSSVAQRPPTRQNSDARQSEQRLSFHTTKAWSPKTNVDADVAIVYGIGPKMAPLLESWRRHGYIADVITGVSWGSYDDYLEGRFDGQTHWDQVQKDANGDYVWHMKPGGTYYFSPGPSYGLYLANGIRAALDAGASSVYLEEPEFWAKSGWEDNFKHEWKMFYGEDWRPPNSSLDAQYRASKLKYFLYRRTLQQIFEYVKEYGNAHGRSIPCYVATHSLLNYANWHIVSPESSLVNVGSNGYVAEIWTGTARYPNYYDSVLKERTFETAFLEYGSMQNLGRASGSHIWFLHDPIEDDPSHDWDDYRVNWESTLTASLLQPRVWRYEIMPYPERVFNSIHPLKGMAGPDPHSENVPIPQSYETELQSVFHALRDMKQKNVNWRSAGTQGVGILVADTMMFERAGPSTSDEMLGSFYGLALPLIAHGVPVEPVHIETATRRRVLKDYKILLLTYEGQKPPAAEIHETLAAWVRGGGALVVIDNDEDPYNRVREWWNSAPNSYATPRQHLFKLLGIAPDAAGMHRVGKGVVLYERASPAALSHAQGGAEAVLAWARRSAVAIKQKWRETNALVLFRGPYVIAAGLEESDPGAKPYVLRGKFVDLFDTNLSRVDRVVINPDSRKLLVDLNQIPKDGTAQIVAASCHVTHERANAQSLTFSAQGIAETPAVVRIRTARTPVRVLVAGSPQRLTGYEKAGGTFLIHFQNTTDPQQVRIVFAK